MFVRPLGLPNCEWNWIGIFLLLVLLHIFVGKIPWVINRFFSSPGPPNLSRGWKFSFCSPLLPCFFVFVFFSVHAAFLLAHRTLSVLSTFVLSTPIQRHYITFKWHNEFLWFLCSITKHIYVPFIIDAISISRYLLEKTDFLINYRQLFVFGLFFLSQCCS